MKKVIALSTVLALGALGFGCDSGTPANNANTGNTAKSPTPAASPMSTPATTTSPNSNGGSTTTPNTNGGKMDNTNKPMTNTNK